MLRLAIAVVVALAASARAERPHLERVPVQIDPTTIPNVVNSKLVFLNRCAGGCTLTPGYTDARTNTSAIVMATSTLSEFSYGDASWASVVECMKQVMAPFNVTVTDVDPGPSVEHFEIMIAGLPTEVGFNTNVGGVAQYACSAPGVCTKYIPNAIVFDFAGTWAGSVNDICSTAAQEIAHTWTLDHVVEPTDPMNRFDFTGMRMFQDNLRCGSDCRHTGVSPYGVTCTESSDAAAPCPSDQPLCQHTCMSTGTATQDNVQILLALFGPAGAVAPTLAVTNPTNGSTQPPGFAITAECTSSDGVQEVDVAIDGTPKATLTAPPFEFPTPATLADGPHTISVVCASMLQATSTVTADIVVARGCAGCEESSGGGCNTTDGVGSLLLALGIAATSVTRRRRRIP
jgi:hypothetical protein